MRFVGPFRLVLGAPFFVGVVGALFLATGDFADIFCLATGDFALVGADLDFFTGEVAFAVFAVGAVAVCESVCE